jgi:hypothetical protein
MHPFREEKPYFGFMSASREMWKKRTRVKSARRIIQIPPMELSDLQRWTCNAPGAFRHEPSWDSTEEGDEA